MVSEQARQRELDRVLALEIRQARKDPVRLKELLARLDRDKARSEFTRRQSEQHFERVGGVGPMVDVWAHDGPTFEQARKFLYETVNGKRRNQTGSALSRLLNRGTITTEQYAAGERYCAHWYLSGLPAPVIAAYGDAIGGGECAYGMPSSELAAHHRARLRDSRDALGPATWPLVEMVVVEDADLSQVGFAIRRKSGAGTPHKVTAWRIGSKAVLPALDLLASYYNIKPKPTRRMRGQGQRYDWRGQDAEDWKEPVAS